MGPTISLFVVHAHLRSSKLFRRSDAQKKQGPPPICLCRPCVPIPDISAPLALATRPTTKRLLACGRRKNPDHARSRNLRNTPPNIFFSCHLLLLAKSLHHPQRRWRRRRRPPPQHQGPERQLRMPRSSILHQLRRRRLVVGWLFCFLSPPRHDSTARGGFLGALSSSFSCSPARRDGRLYRTSGPL